MSRRSKLVDRMREFHETFGHPVGTVVISDDLEQMTNKDAKEVALRQSLIMEEFQELMKAQTIKELAKEATDLVYVIVGMFVAFGWDFDEAFRRVHEANMSKLGDDGKPIYREDNKVLKGPNYKPPDMSDIVS